MEDIDKLKQTLQEIRTIAERQLLVTNVRTYQMVYYADFSEYRNEILDIIKKAESEIKNDTKEPKTYNGYLQDEMQNKYYKGKKLIKRSECPYGGIDCAWCMEDCE